MPWLKGREWARSQRAQQVWWVCQKTNSRRGDGAVLGNLSPCSHTQNFQANETQLLFPAPAKKMRAQLLSRIMLSVDISAIITGILPWFTVDVVDTECTQGHCYAWHFKNTTSLKILHPKGASFSPRTAKLAHRGYAVSIFGGSQGQTGQSPGQTVLIPLMAMTGQVVRHGAL